MLINGQVIQLSEEWSISAQAIGSITPAGISCITQKSCLALSGPTEQATKDQHAENDAATQEFNSKNNPIHTRFFRVIDTNLNRKTQYYSHLRPPLSRQHHTEIVVRETDETGHVIKDGLDAAFILPSIKETTTRSFSKVTWALTEKDKKEYLEKSGIDIIGRWSSKEEKFHPA